MEHPVWVNGSEGGSIAPGDRGLAYGDGLFETLRVVRGRAVMADLHFSRLAASAAALGIALDLPALCRDFSAFLSRCPAEAVAKIVVTRGAGGRGYLPEPGAVPTVVFSAHPAPSHPEALARDGIVAALSPLRLGNQPLLAGHKHLNRLEQVLLRRELVALDADEALVCDQDGFVAEGVFSNVFLVRAGCLCTPLVDRAGIAGVMRAAILDHARAQGMAVEEERYFPDDFRQADEVFFCNSVYGVWPVRSLLGRQWTPGPRTRALQAFWQERIALT
jgi:4-amino-4-deoxychorismate lyase